jgi:MoxR-like ATPase
MADLSATTFDLDAVPDKDRARVAALIPDPRIADIYTPRYPFGMHEFDLFDQARDLRHNILLAGPTGSAKTTVARAYAAARGLPFVSVEFNGGMDVATVLGHTTITDTGGVEWVDGEVTLVARYGGIDLLDECNMAPPRFAAAFHGALDDRRRMTLVDHAETVRLHRDCLNIGAYNDTDYYGTTALNQAFNDRFAIQLQWGYDDNVEETRVGRHSQAVLEVGRTLRMTDDIETPVSTRALEDFIKHARALGVDAAIGLFSNKFHAAERTIVFRTLEAQASNIAFDLGLGTQDEGE